MDFDQAFRSAPDNPEFRPALFWAWNDELKEDELRRQISRFKEMGLGGFFMLGSSGLVPPYLSPRWMDSIACAVAAAQENKLTPWIYDEYAWPSGTAGGLNAQKPPRQRKILQCEKLAAAAFKPTENTLALYAIENLQPLHYHRVPLGSTPAAGEVIAVSFKSISSVDLLDEEVTRSFIRITHEAYLKRFGDLIGNVIPGFFTDEPNYKPFPWSGSIPVRHQQRWKEDLLDHLPDLFLPRPGCEATRYKYWSTATDCFVAGFSAQIGQWCQRHNAIYTGHYFAEDTLATQTAHAGAMMPHYAQQQIPGLDQLCHSVLSTALGKQVSSVTHQLAKPRALAEAFGCIGWEAPPEEIKYLAQWQLALGINFFCGHMGLYSLRGSRKRDFPPSLIHQPWFQSSRKLQDWLARITGTLCAGAYQAPILFLHPVGSTWCHFEQPASKILEKLDRDFATMSDRLLALHYGYDYGDEMLLEQHGGTDGAKLKVGQMEYAVVLLPTCTSLRSSTVDLLAGFLEAGGRVVLAGGEPTMINGEVQTQRLAQLLNHPNIRRANEQSLPDTLEELCPRPLSICDASGEECASVLLHHRRLEGQDLFFLANLDKQKGHALKLAFRGRGVVEHLDAETELMDDLPAHSQKNFTHIELWLEPGGSSLLVFTESQELKIYDQNPALSYVTTAPEKRYRTHRELSGPWTVKCEANALTLDRARWQADGGAWQAEQPVIQIQKLLKGKDRRVTLEYHFTVADPAVLNQPVWLMLETPELYRVEFNGRRLDWRDEGWWVDPSFRKCSVAGWLREGDNSVIVETDFISGPAGLQALRGQPGVEQNGHRLLGRSREGTELESCYLIGNFGVFQADNNSFVLRRRPETAAPGDLVSQGYPFFAGCMTLSCEFDAPEGESVAVSFAEPPAALAKVSVNGNLEAELAWQPWLADFSTQAGRNRLEVALITGLRNLLGPHHLKSGSPSVGVGPRQFLGEIDWLDPDGKGWDDAYHFMPFGPRGVKLLRSAKL